MSEVDRYWQRESERAYDERRCAVRAGLVSTGGQLLGWMRYQITGRDLKAEFDRYWFGVPSVPGGEG